MNNAIIDTVQIPVAGDYRLDRELSTISFRTRHMFGLAPVRGTFRLRDGHIHVADPVHGSAARATVAADSFHTGLPARDTMVRSNHYLEADNHPDITFSSTKMIEERGRWVLHGTLTVRGHARPLEVRVEQVRVDGPVLRLRASARVDRYEFGITTMRGFTGRRLTLELSVTAARV